MVGLANAFAHTLINLRMKNPLLLAYKMKLNKTIPPPPILLLIAGLFLSCLAQDSHAFYDYNVLNQLATLPDGRMVQIAKGTDDRYWVRIEQPDGSWVEEEPSTSGDLLLVDKSGQPFLLTTEGRGGYGERRSVLVLKARDARGTWTSTYHEMPRDFVQSINPDLSYGSLRLYYERQARMGADGVIHIMAPISVSGYKLAYIRIEDGVAEWQVARGSDGSDTWATTESSFRRYFAMDVDAAGKVHACVRDYGTLNYLTNTSGAWTSEVIRAWNTDGSDDAAASSSIAVNPADGKAYAVSSYASRVATGSLIRMQMAFHTRAPDGTWAHSLVIGHADGYIGTDGERGSGFCPQLEFDTAGKPHVLFTDYASSHFAVPGYGSVADEFNGSVRHGVFSGGAWQFRTLFRQTNPVSNQMTNIFMVVGEHEITWMGIKMLEDPEEPTIYCVNGTEQGRFAADAVDTDTDGLRDVWEREKFGNLTSASRFTDDDEDGLSDFQEMLDDTDPRNPDSGLTEYRRWIADYPTVEESDREEEDDPDSDGYSNYFEFLVGGSPIMRESNLFPLKIIRAPSPVSNQSPTVQFSIRNGRTYRLMKSSDLRQWEETGAMIKSTFDHDNWNLSDSSFSSISESATRYYRVKVSLED